MSVVWSKVGMGERIVVIDDLRVFAFPASYKRTSASGLAALADSTPIDELWLDHDLGIVAGTGTDDSGVIDQIDVIVDHLLERAVWDDPYPVGVIVVHSDNPPAAESMVRCLARYYAVRRIDATGYLAPAIADNDT